MSVHHSDILKIAVAPCSRRSGHGFTLVELLVVIAIISVLASIMLPVFLMFREKGQQAACVSNEKQLGLALMQYMQDNDEQFPNGVNPANQWFWAGEGWAGQCSPYVKNSALFHCPDDPTPSVLPANYAVSYGYNINLVQRDPDYQSDPSKDGFYDGSPPSGLSLAVLTAPACSVALFEVSGVTANVTDSSEGASSGATLGNYFSASGNGLDHRLYAHLDATTGTDNRYATGYLGARPTAPDQQFQPALGRHRDGANYLLADGHARWLRGANVSSGINAAAEADPQGATQGGFSAAGTANVTPGVLATFSSQ